MTVPRRSFQLVLPAVVVVAVAVTSCEGPPYAWNPRVVQEAPDGDAWLWECTAMGCSLTQTAEISGLPDCPVGGNVEPGYSWGRFFYIDLFCTLPAGPVSAYSNFGWSRVAVCERDADCPQLFHRGDFYDCVNSICQNINTDEFPRGPITKSVAFELCFSALPREETVHGGAMIEEPDPGYSQVVEAVQVACGYDTGLYEPCEGELPEWCLQP